MKGVIFDLKRFALHDGPGIRTTVFLKGCNMHCNWCHNPESINASVEHIVKQYKLDDRCFEKQETIGQAVSVNDVMSVLMRDTLFMDESGGGVTFSGGEPTQQADFLTAMLDACQEIGLHTAVDTNGLAKREVIQRIAHRTNLFLVDLKHADCTKHQEVTGAPNTQIIENLRMLLKQKANVRVRIPIIPNFNDDNQSLIELRTLLLSMPNSIEQVDLLPYHAMAQNKYQMLNRRNGMTQTAGLHKADLTPAKQLIELAGFKVKIGG